MHEPMTKYAHMDVRGLVAALGGRSHLARRLNATYDKKISAKGIDQWMARNQIPESRMKMILDMAYIDGNEHIVHRYIS